MFRYVVMWKDGGVYADVDVQPIKVKFLLKLSFMFY